MTVEQFLDSNFFGALVGAGVTGVITILIFYFDKRSIRRDREREKSKMKSNYKIFYRTKCNLIIDSVNSIQFFAGLINRHHNPYNIDPIEEINKNLRELKENARSLVDSNLDFVTTDLYELTESIMKYVNEIAGSFEGLLATEDEESAQMEILLDSNSQKLIDLIQNNVFEKDI